MSFTDMQTNQDVPKEPKKVKERRRVNRACIECTRRKIRCDGSLPCKNCEWYVVADQCAYRQRNRRINASWKTVEQLTVAVEVRNQVLARLLPSLNLENVQGISRDDISQLISSTVERKRVSNLDSNMLHSLNFGEGGDSVDHQWDESKRTRNQASPIADDVNGLALGYQTGSYLGPSSISAALRAIFITSPQTKQAFLEMRANVLTNPNRANLDSALAHSSSRCHQNTLTPDSAIPDHVAVDAYFDHIHYFIPMVDEAWFRHEFVSSARTDDAWVALSNMVLAFGSIAAGSDRAHSFYYNRVQRVLGYNVFASGNLEILQALILLGGLYLHYINSPNTAYLIMGTAFRMAIAMALHRDPDREHLSRCSSASLGYSSFDGPSLSRTESRRRTWWCLVCSDAWAGILLGRPSSVRWDTLTMDTEMPTDIRQTQSSDNSAQFQAQHIEFDWSGTALRLNGEFCKISSKIEYRLAQFAGMAASEVITFDRQLQVWEKSRPALFRSKGQCLPRVKDIRDNLHHRFQLARIVISRPFILRLAENAEAAASFDREDWLVVSICRDAASQLIDEICSKQVRNRISVWHNSWFLFLSCMIPLLSICLNRVLPIENRVDVSEVACWREEVERAIRTFKELAPWTRSTDKFGEATEALYTGVSKSLGMDEQAELSLTEGPLHEIATVHQGIISSTSGATSETFNSFPDWFDYGLLFGFGCEGY